MLDEDGKRPPPWGSLFETATRRYTAAGAAFGFLFPVVATAIVVWSSGLPLSLQSALAAQRSQPLLWIIDTAPVFLGLFAALAGRRADSLVAANRRLGVATRELERAKAEAEGAVAERTQQVRAGSDVARAAASILDADRLLREVVNLIVDRFGFTYAAVFTLDAEARYAVLREATGEAGLELKESGYRLEVGGQSIVGAASAWRKPRISGDSRQPSRPAHPSLLNVRSEIALPLLAGETMLGVLDVQSAKEAAFDETTTIVLQSVADQVAIALNNAQQFHRAERQASALEELNRLSHNLAIAASLDAIGRAAATAISSLAAADSLALALTTLAEGGDTVKLVPFNLRRMERSGDSRRTDVERGAILPALPAARTLVGECIRTGQTVVIADVDEATGRSYRDAALARNAGMRSLVGVPLRLGGQTVGALLAGAVRLNAYAPEDVRRVEQIAAQVAVAVESLHRAEDMQRVLEELDAANRRLTGEAWSVFSRRSTLRQREGFGSLFLFRQAQPVVVDVSSAGVDQEGDELSPEIAEAVSTAKVVALHAESTGTYRIAVPILLRGVPIGALRLSVPEHSWSDDLPATLDSIAGHVAQAVENARLVEEAEERATREHALADATAKIRSKADMDLILQTAAEELTRHLGAARVTARLGAVGDSE